MLTKRRTSKRFVLGDTSVDEGNWEDEATDVLPSELIQKFQMKLDADPDNEDQDEVVQEQDGRLLRPPAGTLQ